MSWYAIELLNLYTYASILGDDHYFFGYAIIGVPNLNLRWQVSQDENESDSSIASMSSAADSQLQENYDRLHDYQEHRDFEEQVS